VAAPSVPVLIAGAGPVGLTLALDLAWRGVDSVVVDPQIEVHPHPRAISIGVRNMEIFRRLGLAEDVIDAGVPRGRALDVIYVTRVLEREIFRFRIPSIDELMSRRERLARKIPETAASPYYKCWTAQSPLERVLRRHAQAKPGIDLRLGWRLESFVERGDGVEARIVDAAGRAETVNAEYLAGCDGADSAVRRGLGVRLEGRGALGEALGIYFRAPGLDARLGADRGVMYWILAPGLGGVIYTIDGGDAWVFNRYFAAGEAKLSDPAALVRAAIGGFAIADIPIEILSVQSWLPRQLVAESYGTQRVFLAGDACHLFVPTGGFGMSTGCGDAADLAWKIAAVRAGWGGPRLLAGYDAERRPVGRHNTLEAADNYARSGDIYAVPLDRVAGLLPPKIKHFAPIGVHLGYRYEGSPLIVPDGTAAPPMESASYAPTARPGHRAPHGWLADGRSTLDLFGRGFVLLRFGVNPPRAEFPGLPLNVADIDDEKIAALYERRLVLVRPDGHVAWRGDAPPSDARAVADRVRGAYAEFS
jgi:2-polyprenyl-6-methoxyphenol hydroxylase-like FAD-dependent oxidoreductase